MSLIYDVSGVCGHQEREAFRFRFSVREELPPDEIWNLQNSVYLLLQSFSRVRFIDTRPDLSSPTENIPVVGYVTSIDFLNLVSGGIDNDEGNQAQRPLFGGYAPVAERCWSFLDGVIPIYSQGEYPQDVFLQNWNDNFRGVFNPDYSEHIAESWSQFPSPPFDKWSNFSVVTQFLNS